MKRTDLAIEAHEIWREQNKADTGLSGVMVRDYTADGFKVNRVDILDDEGVRRLNKPAGTYVTFEYRLESHTAPEDFERGVTALAGIIREVLQLREGESVLVAGLGNGEITPDALGPETINNIMVTRHLVEKLPQDFSPLRPVAAISPGVLGTTGIETGAIVKAVSGEGALERVIVVDALASRSLSRLCSTIQIADTGIVPGSGVGNSRYELNKESVGVPVLAIGVPTIVDAATLCADLAQAAGYPIEDAGQLLPHGGGMLVTHKDIDRQIRDVSKLIGYAVNRALHGDLDIKEMDVFLS